MATKLLVKNAKMVKSANDVYTLYNFGIPAYQSATGLVTCKMAGQCAKGCFAQAGAYAWGNVKQAYEYRLSQTQQDNFLESLEKELVPKIKTANRQGKQLVIRIHDSGDFYSVKYLNDWLKIIQKYPNVQFYAYSKEVPIFKRYKKIGKIPSNFTVIYSEGGKADTMIDRQNDRHSRVFLTENALISAGYDNATDDDTVAFTSSTGKIGLLYHGPKSREWNTDK